MSRLLLQSCSLDKAENCGNTALLHARERIRIPANDNEAELIVNVLVKAGYNTNTQHALAFSVIIKCCNSRIIRVLLDGGVAVNAVNKVDTTKTAALYTTSILY